MFHQMYNVLEAVVHRAEEVVYTNKLWSELDSSEIGQTWSMHLNQTYVRLLFEE